MKLIPSGRLVVIINIILILIISVFSIANAGAQILPKALGISPTSLALTLGQWLLKDDKKVFYLEVESSGVDFEAAKNEGFRLAVERAVGTYVLSEREVKNKSLVRDELFKYSAGFVQDFKIKKKSDKNGALVLLMDVWVGESKLADRLNNVYKGEGAVDGQQLAAQVESIRKEKTGKVDLLKKILADFPVKAFDIKVGKIQSNIVQGKVEILVPIVIRWNEGYFSALAETLDLVKDGTSQAVFGMDYEINVIEYKRSSDWFSSYASFKKPELQSLVSASFLRNFPMARLVVEGARGESIRSYCFALMNPENTRNPIYSFVTWNTAAYDFPYSKFIIRGDTDHTMYFNIDDIADPKIIKDISKISVFMSSNAECKLKYKD